MLAAINWRRLRYDCRTANKQAATSRSKLEQESYPQTCEKGSCCSSAKRKQQFCDWLLNESWWQQAWHMWQGSSTSLNYVLFVMALDDLPM